MTHLKTKLLGAAIAAGTLAIAASAAHADVACNRYGECWRTSSHYTNYPTGLGIVFHDDSWRDAHRRHYHWRHDRPDDHGYYSHGRWHNF